MKKFRNNKKETETTRVSVSSSLSKNG